MNEVKEVVLKKLKNNKITKPENYSEAFRLEIVRISDVDFQIRKMKNMLNTFETKYGRYQFMEDADDCKLEIYNSYIAISKAIESMANITVLAVKEFDKLSIEKIDTWLSELSDAQKKHDELFGRFVMRN